MYEKKFFSTPQSVPKPSAPLRKICQEHRSNAYYGYLPGLQKKSGDILNYHLNDGRMTAQVLKPLDQDNRSGAYYSYLPGL